MKASLIILGVTAAVNASFAGSRLQRRTSCSAYEYQKCCGSHSGSWKRSLEARHDCKDCKCPPPPASTTAVQHPTTTTTSLQTTTTPSLTTTTTEVKTTTTASPPPQETGPGSCKATINGPSSQFTDASGTKYTVNCGRDIAGGDFAAQPAASFADCFSLCSQSDVCVGFSWLSGTCYLKSSQNGPLVESPADVAQKVNPPAPKPTTTTTSTTTTSAGPVPTGACKALGSSFGAYTVECGTDYPGGDLSNAPSDSFAGCAAQCDKLAGCLGFSYVGGTGSGVCYFKDNKTQAVPGSVDSAFRPSPVIPAAPKTTTTTTAKISTTTSSAAVTTTTSAVTTTTTAKVTTTTTTTAQPAPSLTYDFQLYDDYSCKRSTGTLRITRARAGECISLDALTKSDSFRYKASGTQDGRCKVVAFDRKDCSGRSVVLSPTDSSQQCVSNYDAVRLECY